MWKIVSRLFYGILVVIMFVAIRWWINYFNDFVNDEENNLGWLTDVVTKPWEITKINNGEFFEKIWDLDWFYKMTSFKNFTYIQEIILLIWSPIQYKEVKCQFNKIKEKMECDTQIKKMKEYGQITSLKINIWWRIIDKTGYRIPIPNFFLIGNREGFDIKTEKKYEIHVDKVTILEKYNIVFTKLQNLLKIL